MDLGQQLARIQPFRPCSTMARTSQLLSAAKSRLGISGYLHRLWQDKAGLRKAERIRKSPLRLAIYSFLEGSFLEEQAGVLAGKIAYHRQLDRKSTRLNSSH